MQDEVKELKSERKIEKREIKQNNLKKKGLIVGAVAGSAVALALGLGLGLGLNKEPKYRIDVNSSLSIASPTGDGKYKIGDEVIIEAEKIDGYTFSHWNFFFSHNSLSFLSNFIFNFRCYSNLQNHSLEILI